MKIGIISDTHGSLRSVDDALTHAQDMDMWLHCGDCVPDAEYLQSLVEVPVYGVAGNCDWPMSDTVYERVIEAAGHKIFMTHGHNHGVRYTQDYIMEAAQNRGCDIAIYGHTHMADCVKDAVLILNPGSAARPRDERDGSFIIMELLEKQEPKVEIIRLV